ncbi:MAG: hypothetical protein RIB84_28530 [Sneathiellaceae bacterium]
MSSFEELQKRVESAERQFAAMSRQRRDYGQRLIDMISMHERNLADSDGRLASLRAEAEEAKALAAERGRELGKVQGENEQLRHMLHALLTAIERGRSNEFEETMLELDQRISAMVAASGDAGPPSAEEVSQAPEIWSRPMTDDDGDGDREETPEAPGWQGIPASDQQAPPNPYKTADRERQVAAEAPPAVADDEGPGGDPGWPDADAEEQAAGAEPEALAPSPEEDLAEDGSDGGTLYDGLRPADASAAAEEADDWDGAGPVGDRPPTLEEVLEFAEASAQDEASAESGEDESAPDDDDRLSAGDMARLTRMLEQSLAAGDDEGAGEAADLAREALDDGASALMQAPISEIADRIRAEHRDGEPAGSRLQDDEDEEGFELLDEAELEKTFAQMSDRLFSEDEYEETGFVPAEARRDDDDSEPDDEAALESAFDLSDLDLGGEIDGPPEAELETGSDGDPETGRYAPDAGDTDPFSDAETRSGGDESGAVEAAEEAELARWQAEVLGRVAAESGDAPAAGQAPPRDAPSSAQAAAPDRDARGGGDGRTRDDDDDDDALAELDAILAEEDRAFETDRNVAPADPEAEWERPAAGAGDGAPRRSLAPALRDSLDDATRAEILARVRQSHTGSRGDQDD